MAMWDPWRGCHRYSEGCRFCYIYKGDAKRGVDTDRIVRAENFDAPIVRKKNGEYRMRPGQLVYLCFSTDFLLEDADLWRGRCWEIIRERSDLHFLFLTKRIERFPDCIPPDWGEGYDNVIVGCTVENQKAANERLPLFLSYPIRRRFIACAPLLESIDLAPWLYGVQHVTVGGESGRDARICEYDWVLQIHEQCLQAGVTFWFKNTGSLFRKDGVLSRINPYQQGAVAKSFGLDRLDGKKLF